MNSISGIQNTASIQGLTSQRKQASAGASQSTTRNTGVDTVTFSAEALALAGNTAPVEPVKQDGLSNMCWTDAQLAQARQAQSGAASSSIFGMLMESLFLAEWDESRSDAAVNVPDDATADAAAPPPAKSVLEDRPQTASLKKVMKDITSGKADMGDVATAMALGSGNSGGSGVTARQAQGMVGKPIANEA